MIESLLVAEALWSSVNGLLRIAAASFPNRLSDTGHGNSGRAAVYVIMIFSALLAIVSVGEVFLICRPFAAQWDPEVLGTCGDQLLSFTTLECTGLVLDLVILIMPVMRLWTLQMSWRSKIETVLILDAGVM